MLNKEKLSYTFLIFVMAGLLGFTAISGVRKQESSSIVKYVSPLIGTSSSTTLSAAKNGSGSENNAQVIPEVTVPFGMTNGHRKQEILKKNVLRRIITTTP